MAVNLTNADKALKTYYLDALSKQLDEVSPFYAMIKKTSNNVFGKEVKQLVSFGINGGIGAGTEEGSLPASNGNKYQEFTSTLKNLYGTIEITDKAIRASENNAGAFVNLLNAEMDGLVKAGAFNLGRMLFGDGSGKIATVASITKGIVVVDSVQNLKEGMLVDFRAADTGAILEGFGGREIEIVDRISVAIKISGTAPTSTTVPENSIITVQGSYNNEITGLGAIFGTSPTLYGVSKATNLWLSPQITNNVGNISEIAMQKALDKIEEYGGEACDIIVCSWGVRRALIKLLATNKRVLDTMELAGGYKALSFNGIPVVADRFCPKGNMYFLNTKDFTLNQLCDWQWLTSDDGSVLKQVAGKPVYTATLVKYAELLCSRPYAQGLLKDIAEE